MVDVRIGIETCGELLERHRPTVRRLCGRMVRCTERADELTQQTLLVAFLRWEALRQRESLRAWLLGIARHLCRNEQRKRRALLTDDGFPVVEDPTDSVLVRLLRHERDRRLWSLAEDVLDPVQLRVLELRFVHERSDEQIGATVGLTLASGARGVLQTCRRRLKVDRVARELDGYPS